MFNSIKDLSHTDKILCITLSKIEPHWQNFVHHLIKDWATMTTFCASPYQRLSHIDKFCAWPYQRLSHIDNILCITSSKIEPHWQHFVHQLIKDWATKTKVYVWPVPSYEPQWQKSISHLIELMSRSDKNPCPTISKFRATVTKCQVSPYQSFEPQRQNSLSASLSAPKFHRQTHSYHQSKNKK